MPQDQKKIPWFKFTPNEWLTGNIVGEDMCAQGVFINICAYYWKEGGSVPLSKIERRYGKYDSFNLIKKEYLKINDNIVNIKFLDEQLSGFEEERKADSENGKRGADARWNKDRGGMARPLPSIADKDIDKEKEKEEVYTSASPIFEKSGKKLKIDPKVGKALKKLNASEEISLADVEERFFKGLGTEVVIEEFQKHFASIGYGYKSDQGVKTVFLSWEGQLRHEKTKTDFDKKIVPVVKMTESDEEEFAKFMQYKPKVVFLCNFLWQEPPEDRTSYLKSLISKYGLEGTMRKIAEYHYDPIGGQTKQTWRNFQMISEVASMTNEVWEEVKEVNEIKL